MIFVFDFDLTLTTTHSGGLPKIQNDYFTDSQKIVIKNLFKYITSLDNSKIIILSRGHQQSIIEYVKNNMIVIIIRDSVCGNLRPGLAI